MPQLWVVAGPNGSGKSTLTRRHLAGRLPVVNPDDIAADLRSAHPGRLEKSVRAGRLALEQQASFLADRCSFAVETTFSGRHEIELMKEAKANGYKVNLVFIGTNSPAISIARVKARTASGGHHVPSIDVTRRYHRSLDNLSKGLSIADRAWVLDNSQRRLRLVISLDRGAVKRMSASLPHWVRTANICRP